ncbi:hippurate hydrolase [Pseudomonas sp. JUb42]|jgi:hippurate hydrolase|uniref:M20 aminoacylase family protein n=1 Tax=Pseudomonas sp. JUb42 TaxID=2940611 RepID=UPI0021678082|nr:M20 aminoacylase family protein [Pseudomonas sp. JUb42]MCS3467350.1 hippurate hydrolase [Pseudomonas sp. JUb42]
MPHLQQKLQTIDAQMRELRQRIHAHPELGYEEYATSDLVAERLEQWGYEVHRGIAATAVIGTLKKGSSSRILGLRADMDALPILEKTGLPYASQIPGKMHACGHDGHTTMLLAAARVLADDIEFDGTLRLIFQPAEEGLAGARRMIQEGVLEQFPCDALFAMHNMPGYPAGKLGFRAGAFMASADQIKVTVHGHGGHGAMPHQCVDPVVVCASIIMALQTIVSRNVSPQEMSVITVGSITAGKASNVIPDSADMLISVRALNNAVRDSLEARIKHLIHAQADAFGARAEVHYSADYPLLINDPAMTEFATQVARDWLGDEQVLTDIAPFNGSEDFAWFLRERPGCYLIIGNGEGEQSCMIHDPRYDFNDDILMRGAGYWIKLTQAYLAPRS